MKIDLKVILGVCTITCLATITLPAIAANPSAHGSGAIGLNGSSTVPARIELKADISRITADDMDNIELTVYAYDVQGRPVADGYRINFTIGSAEGNNFTSPGSFSYVPGAQGRLGSPFNSDNFYRVETGNSGKAGIQFGWVDPYYGGNNSTIWAYSADNPGAFASIKIYSAAPMDYWTGYVVDSYGNGYDGVNVKMHVLGSLGNGTPYEIYTMTRTTKSSPLSVGQYAFEYIVLQNTAYCYMDTEVSLTDNLTVYGRSGNYTMNRSTPPLSTITLKVPLPDKVTLTAEKDTIRAGGEEDLITAQLSLNDSPYRRAGIPVAFSSDNGESAVLPAFKTNYTDADGRAMMRLVSGDSAGMVNVSAEAAVAYNEKLTATLAAKASPRATALATPGFEPLLALAGLFGSFYLNMTKES